MREFFFTLRRRFTRQTTEEWQGYITFSGFRHITEMVTLDCVLCPDLITDLMTEDWNHNVDQAFRTTLFRDADYLWTRQPFDPSRDQFLAIMEHPQGNEIPPAKFIQIGFDIMDSSFHHSTLTNCGPMPELFDPSNVNEYGLLPSIDLANEIRDRMRRNNPDDHHLGQCEVWSICRARPIGSAKCDPKRK